MICGKVSVRCMNVWMSSQSATALQLVNNVQFTGRSACLCLCHCRQSAKEDGQFRLVSYLSFVHYKWDLHMSGLFIRNENISP